MFVDPIASPNIGFYRALKFPLDQIAVGVSDDWDASEHWYCYLSAVLSTIAGALVDELAARLPGSCWLFTILDGDEPAAGR